MTTPSTKTWPKCWLEVANSWYTDHEHILLHTMQTNPGHWKLQFRNFSATITSRKTIRSKYRLEVTNFGKYQQNLDLVNFFNCQFHCVHLNLSLRLNCTVTNTIISATKCCACKQTLTTANYSVTFSGATSFFLM